MELNSDNLLADLSDEQLVERFRSGEEDAFTVLVERYRADLFRFLARMTGRRSYADDVFQDAFMQVYISLDRFDTSRRFRPWLFTIAANKARDLGRRNSKRQAASLSASLDPNSSDSRPYIDLLEADVPLPAQNAEDQEVRQLIKQVVESLPDHLREVLLLAYFQQFSYKEIAEMLDIPLGTVKSRLHSAVGTFAQLWKSRYGDQPPAHPDSAPPTKDVK